MDVRSDGRLHARLGQASADGEMVWWPKPAGEMGGEFRCRGWVDGKVRENSQFLTNIRGFLGLRRGVSSDWSLLAFSSASEQTDWLRGLWDYRWPAGSQGPSPSCGAGASQQQLSGPAGDCTEKTAGSLLP